MWLYTANIWPLLGPYLFIMGACLGSFSNVVVARMPRHEDVVFLRSRCLTCNTPIAWFDNIPIFSYLFLRGQCRHCKASISPRYFIFEIIGGALTLAVRLHCETWGLFFFWLCICFMLCIIAFLDIDYFWIPDMISIPLMVMGFFKAIFAWDISRTNAFLGLLPAVFLYAVSWVYKKWRGVDGLGLGDIKLLAGLGLLLGFQSGMLALFLGALQGSVLGAMINALGGHQGKSIEGDDWEPPLHAIPFGPFLILGFFEMFFMRDVFLGWLSLLVPQSMSLMHNLFQ